MNKKTRALQILSYVFGILLIISVFKNISYPLFWADESMTAMCSERIANYGYPKVHDGKNVVNDLLCDTPTIAVNKKDALIGSDSWGQYYFGVIGYRLANKYNDIYVKTGIYRSTFAIMGLLGLLLLVVVMSSFYEGKFYKYLFISLFLLCEIISASIALHLRQVRYYPLTLFLSSAILSLYVLYRFRKPFNKIFYSITLAALLWLMFMLFSPLYFIFILTIGISETVLFIFQYLKNKNLKHAILPSLPAVAAIILSCIGVFPLIGYFKIIEINKILDNYYHFNSALYWQHFSDELRYFSQLELLWLAVFMRAGVLINYKKVLKKYPALFRVSNFLSLLFIVFIFSIPNMYFTMFSRYLIPMQPVLAIVALADFICLLKLYSLPSDKLGTFKTSLLVIVFTLTFGFTFLNNLPYTEGHIYEMTHEYKGPLDYTIPYIQSHYSKPQNLIIATNYEETSYMYYLKSKTIFGFVGNNLKQDTLYQPDIVSYRQSMGTYFVKAFTGYFKKAVYKQVSFPVMDIRVNNTPELNYDQTTGYNHYFETDTTNNPQDKESLYIKQ